MFPSGTQEQSQSRETRSSGLKNRQGPSQSCYVMLKITRSSWTAGALPAVTPSSKKKDFKSRPPRCWESATRADGESKKGGPEGV